MKLVSFYCDVDNSKYYTEHSIRLKKQCESLNIEHLILHENFGKEWIDNVRAKPIFLRKMLNTINEDFIWLDVDCSIKRKPDFVFNSEWMLDFKKSGMPHDYLHIIKNCKENKDFLERWIKEIEEKKRGSHTAFINIYKSLDYKKVPQDYFSIDKLSDVKSKKIYLKNG